MKTYTKQFYLNAGVQEISLEDFKQEIAYFAIKDFEANYELGFSHFVVDVKVHFLNEKERQIFDKILSSLPENEQNVSNITNIQLEELFVSKHFNEHYFYLVNDEIAIISW